MFSDFFTPFFGNAILFYVHITLYNIIQCLVIHPQNHSNNAANLAVDQTFVINPSSSANKPKPHAYTYFLYTLYIIYIALYNTIL